jgi:DNA primase
MVQPSKTTQRIDTDALKRERPLVDVVASYGIALRREGSGTYRALCPFHQERTPSFWIDMRAEVSEHHYFCFGCLAYGDSITFVMEREACSFQEACERLSVHGRYPVVEPAQRISGRAELRRWEQLDQDSVDARVLEVALGIYEQKLWQNARALAYLERRAVSEEVARAQRLGYANGRSLLEYLKNRSDSRNELLPVAVQLGLVLERPGTQEDAPTHREFFVDRLIIPELRNERPIWLIGRSVEDELQHPVADEVSLPNAAIVENRGPALGAGSRPTSAASAPTISPGSSAGRRPRPKYLGLPGEKPVMGMELVRGRHAAFIVEGPFDLLAAIGWKLPAFAICGTHFPPERLPALGDALAIYGVFDPDRAGRSAAERFAPLFGSRWRPVRLPNGLDLAELAALGAAGRDILDILVGRARASAWLRAQAS